MPDGDVIVSNFDHHGPEFAADPFGVADGLRERCPVSWSEAHGGFWVVASHEATSRVFRDFETFTTRHGAAVPDFSFGTKHLPVTLDPPEHHVFRRYLNPWFELEAIKEREGDIQTLVRGVLAELRNKGEWDFVSDVGEIVPGTITLGILGMDRDRRSTFMSKMDTGMKNQGTSDPTKLATMAADNEWIRQQLATEVAARRERRTDDLFSYLVHEKVGGENLTEAEIADVVMLLLLAGFNTTSGALAATLVHLAHHPDQRAELQQNPERIPRALEEMLRIYTGSTVMARTVVEDVDFMNVHMREGDKVVGLITAANRDDAAFPDATKVDLDRRDKGSLSFGFGIHRCLGIHLARQVLRMELETIFEVMPDYRIDLDRVALADRLGMGYVHKTVPAHLPR